MLKIKDVEITESEIVFILTVRNKPISYADRRRFQEIYFRIYGIEVCITCPYAFNTYFNNLYNQIKIYKNEYK